MVKPMAAVAKAARGGACFSLPSVKAASPRKTARTAATVRKSTRARSRKASPYPDPNRPLQNARLK